jgi:hypothetical protein
LRRLWKRFLSRHVNALSFWAVLVFVALMLLMVTAIVRGDVRRSFVWLLLVVAVPILLLVRALERRNAR